MSVDASKELCDVESFYYAIYGLVTEYQLVSNTPVDNYDGALLPRGGGNASEVTCIAYIADSHAAATRATAVATVLPMVITVSELANLTVKLLAESFEAGNVEASGPGGTRLHADWTVTLDPGSIWMRISHRRLAPLTKTTTVLPPLSMCCFVPRSTKGVFQIMVASSRWSMTSQPLAITMAVNGALTAGRYTVVNEVPTTGRHGGD